MSARILFGMVLLFATPVAYATTQKIGVDCVSTDGEIRLSVPEVELKGYDYISLRSTFEDLTTGFKGNSDHLFSCDGSLNVYVPTHALIHSIKTGCSPYSDGSTGPGKEKRGEPHDLHFVIQTIDFQIAKGRAQYLVGKGKNAKSVTKDLNCKILKLTLH
jgi:hypothetical protein